MDRPIVNFQFADALPLCFSIKTRKTIGQQYSPLRGLYRQYTLIYYRQLVKPKDAERYWKIVPAVPSTKVIQFAAAK